MCICVSMCIAYVCVCLCEYMCVCKCFRVFSCVRMGVHARVCVCVDFYRLFGPIVVCVCLFEFNMRVVGCLYG